MRPIMALALLSVLLGTARVQAQTVRGRLLDAETGEAIAGGTMALLSADRLEIRSVLTDSAGAFQLDLPGPGEFRLAGSRIGYRDALTDAIKFSNGDTLDVEFRLSAEAIVLDPVTVVAHSSAPPRGVDGFYQRMAADLGGAFIGREEIEGQQPTRTTDLLRNVAGVRLVRTRFGDAVPLLRGSCSPQLYLDGLLIRGGTLDEVVHPSQLEGLEIYRGPSEIPAAFTGPGARCGAIILWSRTPP